MNKLKIAIAGVMAFLENEKKEKTKKTKNSWVKSGREIQMRNRNLTTLKNRF